MALTSPAVADLGSLLAASAAGDRSAFRQIYETTSVHLYGMAVRILRDREVAREAVQEAYVSIWRRAADYSPDRGTPLVWMGAIVRNRCLDTVRRRRPSIPIDEAPGHESWADPAPLPDAAAIMSAEAKRVRGCVDRLGEQPRRAILLAFHGGLTHEEVAAEMHAPLGSVKSWIRRGLMQVKDCLAQ
jgi:RNA polymerase sigma-70 factor (ECF subfamily)